MQHPRAHIKLVCFLLLQVEADAYDEEELDPEWAELLGDLDARLQASAVVKCWTGSQRASRCPRQSAQQQEQLAATGRLCLMT